MRSGKLYGHRYPKNTTYSMLVQQNSPRSITNWPKLAIYCQTSSFLASDKQFKTPARPYFEGGGCGKAFCMDIVITKTQFPASVCTNICHS